MYVAQSIRNPGSINVFGSFLVRAEPDFAVLTFDVQHVSEQPARAFSEVRDGVEKVRRFLTQSGVASADVQTARVTLEAAISGYGADAKFIGHRAKLGFGVTARDLDALEPLLVGILDAGASVIHGVRFETSRLRELRAEARRGAIEAARRKAEIYASAAGVKLGAVLHIEDANPENVARRGHQADADLTSFEEDPARGAARAGALTIAAAAMVAFAIIH
jgi:uncharacterized protein